MNEIVEEIEIDSPIKRLQSDQSQEHTSDYVRIFEIENSNMG